MSKLDYQITFNKQFPDDVLQLQQSDDNLWIKPNPACSVIATLLAISSVLFVHVSLCACACVLCTLCIVWLPFVAPWLM